MKITTIRTICFIILIVGTMTNRNPASIESKIALGIALLFGAVGIGLEIYIWINKKKLKKQNG